MSQFYDLASLVVIPSGYKASTIYAQKPLTTDGQLSFSRAGTATRVNSSGLIEAVASNVPRLDYLGSSCPRLLLEPQRTNTLTYSEAFDNAAWTKVNLSVSANTSDTLDPSGYNGADKVTDDATNASHIAVRFSQWDTTQRTASVFAKAGTSSKVYIQNASTGQGVFADLSAGTIVVSPNFTGTLTSYGNGWYRITATHTAASAQTIGIGLFTGTATASYSGTGSYAYIWGAQLEAGAYATSYIPTLGASVTRVADAASKTGISSLIGQTEGTIFVEFQTLQLNPTNVSRIILSDGTTSNYIFLGLNEAGSGNLSRLYVNNTGAGTSVSVFSSTALTVGTNKLAMAYKNSSFALYLNGNLVGSSSSAVTIPATSQLVVGGQSPSATTQLETMVNKQLILFKTRLTNAQLAELTTL